MTTQGIQRIERFNYVLGGIAIIIAALAATQKQALGVAIGVVLTCLNFAALRWLVFRWTAAVKAGDERGSNRIYLILPKMIGMMGAVAIVMFFLPIDAVGFVIGYSVFIPSIVFGATYDALAPAPPEPAADAPDTGPTPPPSPESHTHG